MNKEKMPVEIKKLIDDLQQDFNEFWNTGEIQVVREMNKRISSEEYKLRPDCMPASFYGDLMSEYVVVNLNPGISKGEGDNKDVLIEKGINNFEEYYKYLSDYGKKRFGKKDASIDPFDVKMVGFLAPFDEMDNQFGFIKMKDEKSTATLNENLVKVIESKCQLEFIKYGSPKFNGNDFLKQSWVYERMEEILNIIFCTKRKLIIFNGRMFSSLLKKMQNENIKFINGDRCKLSKNEDELCDKYSYYEIYDITRNGQTVKCIVNRAFYSREFNSYISREEFARFIIKNEFAK